MSRRRLAVGLALVVVVGTPLAAVGLSQSSDEPAVRPYVVQPGDTVCGIAQRLDYKGGCDSLYEANSWVIGSNPDRLQVGMKLFIHTDATNGYVVQPGDTLPQVAARLAVSPSALYAANRSAIGGAGQQLRPGLVLKAPSATPARATPTRPSTTAPLPPGIRQSADAPAAAAPSVDAPSHRRLVIAVLVALAALGLLGLLAWGVVHPRHRSDRDRDEPLIDPLSSFVPQQPAFARLAPSAGSAPLAAAGAGQGDEVAGLRAMLAVDPPQLPKRLAEVVAIWPNDVRVERQLMSTYLDSLATAVRSPATTPASAGRLPDLVDGLDRQRQALAARPAAAFDLLCEMATSLIEPGRPMSESLRQARATELAQLLERHWASLRSDPKQQDQLNRMRPAAAQFATDWRDPSAASTTEFARLRSQLLSEISQLSRSRNDDAGVAGRRLIQELELLKSSWKSTTVVVEPASPLKASGPVA